VAADAVGDPVQRTVKSWWRVREHRLIDHCPVAAVTVLMSGWPRGCRLR
jgi:hypothetical protein